MTEFHYKWSWDLKSDPEALWPLVSDTDRMDRESGLPPIKILQREGERRTVATTSGMKMVWEEAPFDWIAPAQFGVARRYSNGPFLTMRVFAQMFPKPGGGCELVYEIWVVPRNTFFKLIMPLAFRGIRHRFGATFRKFDAQAVKQDAKPSGAKPKIPLATRLRFESISQTILRNFSEKSLLDRFFQHLLNAGDSALLRIRPYALADQWKEPRKKTLELFLHATRAGAVDFQWEVICPLCRGSETRVRSLSEINPQAHCSGCNIDYTANLDQLVELTFRPNPLLRPVKGEMFCAGNPQLTPHIISQTVLSASETREITLKLQPGKYRARVASLPGGQMIEAGPGKDEISIRIPEKAWPAEEIEAGRSPKIKISNPTASSQRFILERMAWNDQAATAREVILMPAFKDLFSEEALRPGEKISVGTVAILFTDLKGSTALYRQIGDAVAFGWVMDHFEVLSKAIRKFDGTIVKTIGDAVMAVFAAPDQALQAAALAQEELAKPGGKRKSLALKAGIHYGPCIAVTQNGKLDYFGTTVNFAARLTPLSSGKDIIFSEALNADPAVRALTSKWKIEPFSSPMRGFEGEIPVYRVLHPR